MGERRGYGFLFLWCERDAGSFCTPEI